MMTVLYSGDKLLKEPAGFRLGHPPVRDDVVEELAAGVLQNDDDVRVC